MKTDEYYMQLCLSLAQKGLRVVAPNPMVGCVIVHDGKIIGKGYHKKFGGPHAEVNAIQSVKNQKLLKESMLYVNLEPCSHFGKTPPCVDLIIEKKIPHVVIGSRDPNPLVSGKGIKKMRRAGIKVTVDVLKEKCDELNKRFITFHTKKRPYIILKWAQSSDGFMAPKGNKQKWLTGPASKKLVHQWRSEEQAILVGWKTVNIDQPLLTVRLVKGINPMRIVIDRKLRLNVVNKTFLSNQPLWILNEKWDGESDRWHMVKLGFDKNGLQEIMKFLYSKEIQSLIVEGGLATLKTFIKEGLWDEARIFTTKHLMKEGKKSPRLGGRISKTERVGRDQLVYREN
ncbi:MAG: bifunctional diaminohydroxyphosphoribosylaminopyrimidine deaminase/5-amino-6-(5-phosphoribosylamino)uracil reductase RibD [Bacteroidetes bacterium]|nr:bifunctional diaminohydroxyphosphoribosylaminopyrimidine deaminase/5-amino-6-(5-phosphoribosylamino)uracil reductase RibD [Bacteroidota bacterium]